MKKTCHQNALTLFADYTYALRFEEGRSEIEWIMGCDPIFGYHREAFLAHFVELLHPDDKAQFQWDMTRVMSGEQMAAEYCLYASDGSVVWIQSRMLPVMDGAQQNIAWLYGAIQDITSQKLAQDALKQREQTFRTLVEHSSDLIARIDRELRHIYINPAVERLTGITLTDYVGKTNRELGMPEELVELWDAATLKVFETGEESLIEFGFLNADGINQYLEARLVPEIDENGNVATVLGITRDITQRKQEEAQRLEMALAHEHVQILKRFTSGAAHDLITPLTGMKTGIYLLKRTTHDPAQLRRLELLEDQTGHIEESVQALLKMTQLKQADFQLEPENFNEFIQNTLVEQKTRAAAKNQRILFLPDARIQEVMLDQYEFKFVLRELLANAVAHSDEGQTITVRTGLQGEFAMFAIEDQGGGITPRDLPHIFEPFYREEARGTDKGGVGLGLTIVKWIVQAHGGFIEVESERGVGSTFYVYLPAGTHSRDED